MLKIQKCSYIVCSKAEVFIHVAIQNFTMWLSFTEIRITAGQQTISDQCVLCLTTLVRYPVKSDLKLTVLAYCPDLYHGLL